MNVWFPAYTTNLSEKWIYMATWQLNVQKKIANRRPTDWKKNVWKEIHENLSILGQIVKWTNGNQNVL